MFECLVLASLKCHKAIDYQPVAITHSLGFVRNDRGNLLVDCPMS